MPFLDLVTSEQMKEKFKKKDKVAIIGFAESWNKAPYNDDTFEIWGLNSLFELIPKWDLWFEIHERKIHKMDTDKTIGYGLTRTGQPYMEALAQLKCKDVPTPILMVEAYPDFPTAVKYPLDEIVGKFGNYFNNSISYMLALAIDWGYPEIHVYGVDMATMGIAGPGGVFPYGGEYSHQRPSCEYFLGIAFGRGIKLYLPPTSDLLKTRYLYGFEDEKIDNFDAKIDTLIGGMNTRFTGAQQNGNVSITNVNHIDGRMEQLRQIMARTDLNDEIKKWIDEQMRFLVDSRTKEWAAFETARKQQEQYIGAIECAKEIKKIWQ